MAEPPRDSDALALWIQNAAGFLIFERIRAAGLATIATNASPDIVASVQLAVDATIYALMMQIDGVSTGLQGKDECVKLAFHVKLMNGESVLTNFDLANGDGMCMGFHSWCDGDFGDDPIVNNQIPPRTH